MKRLVFVFLVGFLIVSCSDSGQTFRVINGSDTDFENKEVIIKKDGLKSDGLKYPVIYGANDQVVPTQLDDLDGDGNWDELVFQVTIGSNSEMLFSIIWVDQAEYPEFDQKTQIYMGYSESRDNEFVSLDRQVREEGLEPQDPPYYYQLEGPGWENNKVGFRSYFDTRNGKDIYGKTTGDLTIHNVGTGENYHVLQPWGMDILKVGNSLGAGALAMQKNDSLFRLGATDFASFEKVIEGPVRSVFKLNYKGWNVADESYELAETISIWANKRWYQSQIELSPVADDTLVTGIVNFKAVDVKSFSYPKIDVLRTHGKQSENQDYLGMALLIPSEELIGFSTTSSKGEGIVSTELVSLKSSDNKYLFYFYVGWEGEKADFSSSEFFDNQLKLTSEELSNQLKVVL